MGSPSVFDEDSGCWVHKAAIADLAVSVGTGNDTVVDVGVAYDQATLNNNFRDLADKLNLVLAALRSANLIAGD
jgi:hypothetical protein